MGEKQFDLLVKMIENVMGQVNKVSDKVESLGNKITSEVGNVHKRIDKHITDPCGVQNELTEHKQDHNSELIEHKKNHASDTSNKKLSVANWIAFIGVAAAIFIAIFK